MTKFGHNLGYIDELFRRYRSNPESVSEAWREFFRDYSPEVAETAEPGEDAPRQSPSGATPPEQGEPDADLEPLRGAAARIVENMDASLEVPTATSVRTIPVKLLEENRRILNQHQAMTGAAKISFTHLLAWGLVRALEAHPEMNARFRQARGRPHRARSGEIRLGVAIDVEKRGERVLLVPNLRNPDKLSFPEFVAAYDDVVARARAGRLEISDFEGTTVTLTNPGMLGTMLSVPRLMQGQAAIFGIGSIALPAEYSGMAAEMVSELGLSKTMTVTSTYDHRVIQGAESGSFLASLERLLLGADRFYRRIFSELSVPREPIEWSADRNPQMVAGGNHEAIAKQAGVLQLIRAYRVRGHLWADLDPLGYDPEPYPELELSTYGLSVWDLDRRFIAGGFGGGQVRPLREIHELLQNTYCRHVGAEFMHIQDPEPRQWLIEKLERPEALAPLPREDQIEILRKLNATEAFERFLHTNYVGQKRFSLEGAETLIPMLDTLLRDGAEAGVEQSVIGLAHRGRLNVLAHIVGKPYGQIFREFEEVDPETTHGSGDVKYHLGASGEFDAGAGRKVRVVVASNPSHLEAVDPVVEGMARARQDRLEDVDRRRVLPVLIHGDAAFSGQGVLAETLNLSQLSGYRTGGTVHVVINNQIGFTTGPADARSSEYPTDVAKMVHAPIFHVNGDHPEDAVRVMRLALAFRQQFQRDVVVDLVCYRRWGHNEADDPSYTHPILYAKIESHRSVRKRYTERLLRSGDFDPETAERALEDYRQRLREVHDEVQAARNPSEDPRPDPPEKPEPAPLRDIETAVDAEVLDQVLVGLGRTPRGFETHPKLARQIERRVERFEADQIDWGLAEALAFGSLVLQGRAVRLSGEDSGRGTFSQRHSILYDHRTAEPWVPLDHLSDDQGRFQVYDSLLSEFAVLGFEFGYSVDAPETLVMWEAQFGDFSNGAQVIIDQFLAGAEAKWGQRCAVTLLLPHGYEGQGPEHSSARLERFLQLCAEQNLRVAYPSTPAQYFHLLRYQALCEVRKPLVVMTPKSLLRHSACIARPDELTSGSLQAVLDDPQEPRPDDVRRLLLCSGKVWYDLDAARQESGDRGVALTRIECLYPFPQDALAALARRYGSAEEVVWVQEEPRNMGAWSFLRDRLETIFEPREVGYVGRQAGASPATGSHRRHETQQKALVAAALKSEAVSAD